MSPSQIWRELFVEWPSAIPRRGMIVSTLNEPMPFKGFMVKGETLLLERTNPDALGARFIVMTFDTINCLKFVDPLTEEAFTKAGYQGKFAK